jgi:hypothetical protein
MKSENTRIVRTALISCAGIVSILFGPACAVPAEPLPTFTAEVEAGPVWQSGNDVQIPNTEDGTRFSIVDLIGNGPYPAARLYITWNIADRHGLRLLLAPLNIKGSGVPGAPIDFAGEAFDPGVSTDATYKFNSWRITYRYRLYNGQPWRWWVGFTGKIRDAKIELGQPGKRAEKTDVGFVPLLHIAGEYRLSPGWRLRLDLDALAGGPGRAVDAAINVRYDLGDRWSLSVGYRTIEGGANVEEVYNFAWLHYATISVLYRL